ncbi:hypothetical protein LY78DRAFT_129607 [Colletotrichum sublineola]|nr:hypothetical protein LY78DRAFT_129607 [Colletotrichum sublineola]
MPGCRSLMLRLLAWKGPDFRLAVVRLRQRNRSLRRRQRRTCWYGPASAPLCRGRGGASTRIGGFGGLACRIGHYATHLPLIPRNLTTNPRNCSFFGLLYSQERAFALTTFLDAFCFTFPSSRTVYAWAARHHFRRLGNCISRLSQRPSRRVIGKTSADNVIAPKNSNRIGCSDGVLPLQPPSTCRHERRPQTRR